ncbi:acyl-CoA-binding protein [Polaribacter sp.]|nr:acyl-CoA-binding protein [Polaribacter sp.]
MLDDLDKRFVEAFERISCLKKAVAPDVMLKLYAFNKQANFGNNFSFNSGLNVRNAFKFNAWMQLKDMTPKEAKKEYIKLANTIIKLKK